MLRMAIEDVVALVDVVPAVVVLVPALLVDPVPTLAKATAVPIHVEETHAGLAVVERVRALEAVLQTIAVLVVQMPVEAVVQMPVVLVVLTHVEVVVQIPVALRMRLLQLYQNMQVQNWKTSSLAIVG